MEPLLEISRISRTLSLYLRQHDLTQCVRVNSVWHQCLNPHLWSFVKGFNLRHFQSPEIRAALLKYGHHIRVLKTSSHEFLTLLGTNCQNLVMFDYSGSFPVEGHEDGYISSAITSTTTATTTTTAGEEDGSGSGSKFELASRKAHDGEQQAHSSRLQQQYRRRRKLARQGLKMPARKGVVAAIEQPDGPQGDDNNQPEDEIEQLAPQPTLQQQKLNVMASFLLRNKDLFSLSFRRRVDSSRYIDRLLTEYPILEQLLHLKDLTISSKSLHSSALAMILQHGHKLESLALKIRQVDWQIRVSNQELVTIIRCSQEVDGVDGEHKRPWKLKVLLLGPALGLNFAMIVKAAGPTLEWLRLERLSLHEARELAVVVRDHCPRLNHLLIMTDNQIDKNGLMLLLDATVPVQAPQGSVQVCQKQSTHTITDTATATCTERTMAVPARTTSLTKFQAHALEFPDFLVHRMLGAHYESLDMLDLSRCRWIRSETVQQILCSCPHLRVFDLVSEHLILEANDIVHGAPWVCQKLQILRVEITVGPVVIVSSVVGLMSKKEDEGEDGDGKKQDEMRINHYDSTGEDFQDHRRPGAMDGNNNHAVDLSSAPLSPSYASTRPLSKVKTRQEIQQKVLAQIGRLSQLEELRIGGLRGLSLDLTLGSGALELLSELKRMRTLNVKDMGHKCGQQELEWMVNQWPMIRCFMFENYHPEQIDLDKVNTIQQTKRKNL
ncbi:hypothetical protein BG004_000476 [Podila humilis]|nr:hypothetical protein BG004_000476 [Podila humilis]